MDNIYLDLFNLGTAISALLGYVFYDISKGGVKWYVSLNRMINSFLSTKQ